MNLRNLLIAALLFGGLAAYVLVFERQAGKNPAVEEKAPSVLDIPASDIQAISLQLREPFVELEKKDGQWLVMKPDAMQADSDTVQAMLDSLEYLAPIRVLEADTGGPALELAQYGLEYDEAKRIILKTPSQERILLFGRATPAGNSIYMAVQDRPAVFVVTSTLLNHWDKSPEDLRNRVILEFNLDQIDALTLQNPKGLFELELRKTDTASQWTWKRPVAGKQVHQEALNTMLWELRRLKFKTFLGAEGEPAKIWSNPAAKISVVLKDRPDPRVLLLGNALPDGSWTAKIEGKPDVFTLDAQQAQPLMQDLSQDILKPPTQS